MTFCYAPVRDHIPSELHCDLPHNFLNSAVVSSHELDRMLRDKFTLSFVLPRGNTPMNYSSCEPTVNRIKELVPPAIFLALLDFGIIHRMEGKPVHDVCDEKLMEELYDYND